MSFTVSVKEEDIVEWDASLSLCVKQEDIVEVVSLTVSVSNKRTSLRCCVTHGLCVKEEDIAEGDASLSLCVKQEDIVEVERHSRSLGQR